MSSDNESGGVLAVTITFLILSWAATILRAIVRCGMLKSYGRDDWAMLVAQLFFTAYSICQIGAAVYGTGRHLADLEPSRAKVALQYWFFCEIFFILSTATMKVSICFFLLRVSSNRIHIWTLRFLVWLSATCGVAFFFLFLFQCKPISTWWSLVPHQDRCIPVNVIVGLTYGVSALIVSCDWCLGILPIFIVRHLSMSPGQRILVGFILALAVIGSTATIVRLPYVGTLADSFKGRDADFLYDTVNVAIWSNVEVGIGITAGSIATLRPLIHRLLDRLDVARYSRSRSRKAVSPRLQMSPITPTQNVLLRVGYEFPSSPEMGMASQESLAPLSFAVNKTPALDQSRNVEDESDRGIESG